MSNCTLEPTDGPDDCADIHSSAFPTSSEATCVKSDSIQPIDVQLEQSGGVNDEATKDCIVNRPNSLENNDLPEVTFEASQRSDYISNSGAMVTLDTVVEEWNELDQEFQEFEAAHRSYVKKVHEVKQLQQKCISNIAHQKYRMKAIQENIHNVMKLHPVADENHAQMTSLEHQLVQRKAGFRDYEDVLPHENGLYLRVILGSVNVSLLSKQDKFSYKENYEQFKLIVTMIAIVMACLLYLINYRVIDAAFQFLMVWYYCTLTIREHILKVNGSRIKGWWITHHFISTVCAGILLIWPEGYSYSQFRYQFVYFSIYASLVQVVQYYYQKGSLYRLRALGERHNMDITVEGFQSWMWRGLTSVLPFLLGGYIFQLYNAYTLFHLSLEERCTEWQVFTSAAIFLLLFLGNTITTAAVFRQKVNLNKEKVYQLLNKYKFSLFHQKLHNN